MPGAESEGSSPARQHSRGSRHRGERLDQAVFDAQRALGERNRFARQILPPSFQLRYPQPLNSRSALAANADAVEHLQAELSASPLPIDQSVARVLSVVSLQELNIGELEAIQQQASQMRQGTADLAVKVNSIERGLERHGYPSDEHGRSSLIALAETAPQVYREVARSLLAETSSLHGPQKASVLKTLANLDIADEHNREFVVATVRQAFQSDNVDMLAGAAEGMKRLAQVDYGAVEDLVDVMIADSRPQVTRALCDLIPSIARHDSQKGQDVYASLYAQERYRDRLTQILPDMVDAQPEAMLPYVTTLLGKNYYYSTDALVSEALRRLAHHTSEPAVLDFLDEQITEHAHNVHTVANDILEAAKDDPPAFKRLTISAARKYIREPAVFEALGELITRGDCVGLEEVIGDFAIQTSQEQYQAGVDKIIASASNLAVSKPALFSEFVHQTMEYFTVDERTGREHGSGHVAVERFFDRALCNLAEISPYMFEELFRDAQAIDSVVLHTSLLPSYGALSRHHPEEAFAMFHESIGVEGLDYKKESGAERMLGVLLREGNMQAVAYFEQQFVAGLTDPSYHFHPSGLNNLLEDYAVANPGRATEYMLRILHEEYEVPEGESQYLQNRYQSPEYRVWQYRGALRSTLLAIADYNPDTYINDVAEVLREDRWKELVGKEFYKGIVLALQKTESSESVQQAIAVLKEGLTNSDYDVVAEVVRGAQYVVAHNRDFAHDLFVAALHGPHSDKYSVGEAVREQFLTLLDVDVEEANEIIRSSVTKQFGYRWLLDLVPQLVQEHGIQADMVIAAAMPNMSAEKVSFAWEYGYLVGKVPEIMTRDQARALHILTPTLASTEYSPLSALGDIVEQVYPLNREMALRIVALLSQQSNHLLQQQSYRMIEPLLQHGDIAVAEQLMQHAFLNSEHYAINVSMRSAYWQSIYAAQPEHALAFLEHALTVDNPVALQTAMVLSDTIRDAHPALYGRIWKTALASDKPEILLTALRQEMQQNNRLGITEEYGRVVQAINELTTQGIIPGYLAEFAQVRFQYMLQSGEDVGKLLTQDVQWFIDLQHQIETVNALLPVNKQVVNVEKFLEKHISAITALMSIDRNLTRSLLTEKKRLAAFGFSRLSKTFKAVAALEPSSITAIEHLIPKIHPRGEVLLERIIDLADGFRQLGIMPQFIETLETTQPGTSQHDIVERLGVQLLGGMFGQMGIDVPMRDLANQEWNYRYLSNLFKAERQFDTDSKEYLRVLLKATLQGDFAAITLRSEELTVTGEYTGRERELIQQLQAHNNAVKTAIERAGLNYREWMHSTGEPITFSPDLSVMYDEQATARALRVDLATSIGEIVTLLRQDGREGVVTRLQEIFADYRNPDMEFTPERMEHLSLDDMRSITQRIIGIEKSIVGDEYNLALAHLRGVRDSLEEIGKMNTFAASQYAIRQWRAKPGTDLFQGNETHCCIAIDHFNQGAIVDYLMDTGMTAIEVVDTNADRVAGQAFVFLAEDTQGELALVLDNIEMNNSYAIGRDLLAEQMFEYARQFTQRLSGQRKISRIVLGTHYNDLDTGRLTRSSMQLQKLTGTGILADEEQYLDVFGGWTDPRKPRQVNVFNVPFTPAA